MAELAPSRSALGAFIKSPLGVRLMTPPGAPGPDILHDVTLTQDPGNVFAFRYDWIEHGDTTTAYPAGTAATAVLFGIGGAEVARLETHGNPTFSALTFYQLGGSSQFGRPVSVPTPAGSTAHAFIRGTAPLPATLPELGKIEIRQSSDQAIIQTFDDIATTRLQTGAEAFATYTEPEALTRVEEDGGAVCPGTGEVFALAIRWRVAPSPTPGSWEVAIDTGSIAAYFDAGIPGACQSVGASFGWRFLDGGGAPIDQAAGVAFPGTGDPTLARFPLVGGGEWPGQDGGLWDRIRQNVGEVLAVEPVSLVLINLAGGAFTMAIPPYQLTHRP